MGRVYKAVHPNIGSRVAIKVLSKECSENQSLVERFFAEARAVNLIRHEGIVNVLDLSVLTDGRPYIVMEYLAGAALTDVMKLHGPLPLGTLARMMGEVLGALASAHAAGVVHRDLKPDNIFITPNGRAKVLDFGIAKLMPGLVAGGPSPTRTGSLLGTPHYMSPEQARALPVDARTDVYACGVILFEGATGQKPFVGQSLFDLLRHHLETLPPSPRTLRPDIPPGFEAVILRSLAKDPSQRPQSASELAEALAQVTEGLPPAAWTNVGVWGDGPTAEIGPPSVPTPLSQSAQTPASQPGLAHTGPSHQGPASHVVNGFSTDQHGINPTPNPTRPAKHRTRYSSWLVIAGVALVAGIVGAVIVISGANRTSPTVAMPEPGTQAPSSIDAQQPTLQPKQHDTADAALAPTNQSKSKTRTPIDEKTASSKPTRAGRTPNTSSDAQTAQNKPTTLTAPKDRSTNTRAASSTPPAPQPQRGFNITKFLPKALRMARKHYPDAVLHRIDAKRVHPNGKADLSLPGGSVLYRFSSPSRAQRPAGLAKGVPHKPRCMYYVNVSKSGVSEYPADGFKCNLPVGRMPRCSVRQIWRRAIGRGAPSSNAVADVSIRVNIVTKRLQWHFAIPGTKTSFPMTDSC